MGFDKSGYMGQGEKRGFYWHIFAWVFLTSIFYFFFWSYSWGKQSICFLPYFGSIYDDSDLLAA